MMNRVKRILLASSVVLLGLAGQATSAMAAPANTAIPGGAADAPFATPNASGTPVLIRNSWTGQCADLPNYGAPSLNAPVNQYTCNDTTADNQLWYLVPTRTAGGYQLFEFVNAKGGLCLDLPNYGSDPIGTHVSVYTCNSNPANDNQEWYSPDGLQLINYKDGLCLDVSGWASDGSDQALNLPLTVYPCYNSAWANGGFDDHLWYAQT